MLLFVASPGRAPAGSARTLALDPPPTPAALPARLRVAPGEPERLHELLFARDGEASVELLWYHPLAGDRALPAKADRRFGASRPGSRRSGCGGGHCGVDLGDRAGQVVHAAMPGRVTRLARDADSTSGLYVRLEHDAGFATYYMHLDRIHPDLELGMDLAAGEPLGTVGATGVVSSPPHLHFAVSRLEAGRERFLDPEPMLERAIVLDEEAPFPGEPDPVVD
jgi:murein DD-endopeptidase MepM/ murein hydrolase activator NlpD